MNEILSGLLENLQTGMLWLSRDGLVRFDNRQAVAKRRMGTGARVQDPTLLNAVNGTVIEQIARTVRVGGQPGGLGEPVPELRCEVLPGLSRDDAMVLVTDSADEHAAHALDALCNEVDEVAQVLAQLSDLAAVWSSESLTGNDRIEPWPVLQQAWAKVEPLALGRNLTARFTAQGPKPSWPPSAAANNGCCASSSNASRPPGEPRAPAARWSQSTAGWGRVR